MLTGNFSDSQTEPAIEPKAHIGTLGQADLNSKIWFKCIGCQNRGKQKKQNINIYLFSTYIVSEDKQGQDVWDCNYICFIVFCVAAGSDLHIFWWRENHNEFCRGGTAYSRLSMHLQQKGECIKRFDINIRFLKNTDVRFLLLIVPTYELTNL